MLNWWKFFLSVESVNRAEAEKIMAEESSWTLLDVRQPDEYATGHIKGSLLMPVSEVSKRCIELDREATMLVYCKSGGRSKLASRILAAKGFPRVVNVDGGITAWNG